MAMHEDWCMSLERWITQAQSWLKSPNPRAILKAQIALDFRWVAGDRLLVESLEKGFSTIFAQRSADQLQSAARQSFLRTMLSDLLERGVQAVPAEWQLSLYRMIGGARTKHLCQRDIKLHGTALIVDAVRFLVLSKLSSGQWMPHGTVERLQWLERNHIMSKDEASALIEAFEALTHWRLEKQMAMLAKRSDEHMCASGNRGSDKEMPAPNHINLLALHSNERSHFRAYVQSIAQLRERLRMDFAA
jgi:signal-transduction protein with cAMP-binding, CBS, and nucleotidyltransferase domain